MAAGSIEVEVKGATELARALDDAKLKAADLRRIHDQQAMTLQALAQAEAPRRSGTLAGSISVAPSAKSLALRASAPYAGPIHYGWRARNIAPNPFLIRARDAVYNAIESGYKEHTKGLVDGISRASYQGG